MSKGENPISKFHSTSNSKSSIWNESFLIEALKNGIIGPTKSLVGDFSNEEKIIETIKHLNLYRFTPEDVESYKTPEGFDYQNFLLYALRSDKFWSGDIEKLEKFVFVEELLSNPKEILERFELELKDMEKRVHKNGAAELKGSSFGLIFLVCLIACRDVEFRKKHKEILLSIASLISLINRSILSSKASTTVKYKGVTIKTIGDNPDALKDGLTRVMQAINKLSPPFRKQLTKIDHIEITDCPEEDDFWRLIHHDEYLNDRETKQVCVDSTFSRHYNVITFHNIENNFKSVNRIVSVFSHELGHSMDSSILLPGNYITERTNIWKNAKEADGNSVTEYGDKFLIEDFAEFCELYVDALNNYWWWDNFIKKYPNRLRVLEALLDIRMFNKNKPNKIPFERRIEICKEFDGQYITPMDTILTKKEIRGICSKPPDEKIAFTQEMITRGVPLQFIKTFGIDQFFKGMKVDDFKQLFMMFESVSLSAQYGILEKIYEYGDRYRLFDKVEIIDRMKQATPYTEQDEKTLTKFRQIVA